MKTLLPLLRPHYWPTWLALGTLKALQWRQGEIYKAQHMELRAGTRTGVPPRQGRPERDLVFEGGRNSGVAGIARRPDRPFQAKGNHIAPAG